MNIRKTLFDINFIRYIIISLNNNLLTFLLNQIAIYDNVYLQNFRMPSFSFCQYFFFSNFHNTFVEMKILLQTNYHNEYLFK